MQEHQRPPLKRKKIKNKTWVHYFLLFALVFSVAFIALSYFVESFSPKVDVAIGNNESLTLNDNDGEYKNVDERLKWIQMEDELPTVALKDKNEKNKKDNDDSDKKRKLSEQMKKNEKKENILFPAQPVKSYKNNLPDEAELDKQKIKNATQKPVNENLAPKPVTLDKVLVQNNKESRIVEKTYKPNDSEVNNDASAKKTAIIEPVIIKTVPVSKPSKVYIGQYNTIEEAIRVQRKISSEESDLVPFTKYINGQYTIQAGSFSDKTKAQALVSKLKAKGYDAKCE